MDLFVDWSRDPEDDVTRGVMDNETAAEILGENIDQAIAAELGLPDPRVVDTPSAPTVEDGEQPTLPEPWNDDEVTP